MPRLTEMQAKFAEKYCSLGGANGAEAARMAGYKADRAKVEAYELLRLPHVLIEIRRLAEARLRASVAFAAEELLNIAQDRQSKDRAVQLKAVQAVLDRGGMLLSRIDELHVHHHVETDQLPAGTRLARAITAAMGPMGLMIADQGKFDAYMASLNEPAMIDVTPEPVLIEAKGPFDP